MINAKLQKKRKEDPIYEIKEDAKNLMNRQLPYLFLCLVLAELQMLYQNGSDNYTVQDIKKRIQLIIKCAPTYKQICLLTTLHKKFLKKIHLCPKFINVNKTRGDYYL